MSIIKETMLIFVSSNNNNNKFYHVKLHESGIVEKTWGRVGSSGTTSSENGGERGYERIIKQKKAKGYKETETLTDEIETTTGEDLHNVASSTLIADASDTVLAKLVETLVKKNNHAIIETSGGKMKVSSDGFITTPLGLVSKLNIRQAKKLLKVLEGKDATTRTTTLDEYLTLVPQKVNFRSTKTKFLETSDDFQKQKDFLEQLEVSVDTAEDRRKLAVAATTAKGDTTLEEIQEKYANLFKYKISVLDDDDEFNRIQEYYTGGKKTMHSSSRLKLKKVYVLEDLEGQKEFTEKLTEIGNPMELWHGTRVWNILSILKSGLITRQSDIPKTVHQAGMAYGYGTYFSASSTKSLNYAYGYWDRSGRDSNCFMFLADVAMGRTHYPSWSDGTNNVQRSGKYDSIYAKSGSGVINSEMILWNSSQFRLKYLCEFYEG